MSRKTLRRPPHWLLAILTAAAFVVAGFAAAPAVAAPPPAAAIQTAAQPAPVAAPAVAPAPAKAGTGPVRIMAVGDSITEALNVGGGGYRTKLGQLLTAAGVPHEFYTVARGGYRCGDLTPLVATALQTYHPDLVLLNCGTNNAANGPGNWAFRVEYLTMWNTILNAYVDTRIVPSWIQYSAYTGHNDVVSWLPGNEATINDVIYSVSQWRPVGTRTFWPAADFQQIPAGYLDAGGIHPTQAGYDIMAYRWYVALRADPIFQAQWNLPEIPTPCGLVGHRPDINTTPGYRPCETVGGW